MKWLKLCALLVLTLSVMRGSSWAVGWALTKKAAVKVRPAAIVSNFAAFLAFLLHLYFNLFPGEPMDMAAVAFGATIFVIYTVTDFFWRPWERRV